MNANGVTVTGTCAALWKYSDHFAQPHSIDVVSDTGSSSTKHRRSATSALVSGRVGAMPKPQLPMIVVVTP